MARPIKQGLDYFPLDTALDDKFSLIEAEFGCKGFAVIVKLFQKIYLEQGYYCEWSQEAALMFTRKYCPDVDFSVVSEIVQASVRRGIFNKDLFEDYGILTSKGIQKRYFEIARKRINPKIEKAYLLVNGAGKNINADNNGVCKNDTNKVNADNNEINASENDTNKIKENKSKVNKTTTDSRLSSVYLHYCQNINPLPSRTEIDEMNYWINEAGVEEEMFIECINAAAMQNKKSMRYIKGILENKVNKGITTAEAFRNSERIRQLRKGDMSKSCNGFSSYENQREFTSEEGSERQQLLMKELLGG